MALKHLIGRFFELFSTHSYRHYATEGPYDDGHYWRYYRCRRCGKHKIGPKRWVDKHGEPDQPWPHD